MIRRTSDNLLNMGIRPTGLFEIVDPLTCVATFSPLDPGGDPIDISVTPFDIPFPDRLPGWLTTLRESRKEALLLARKTKGKRLSSSQKGISDDPLTPLSTTPAKRSPRKKVPPASLLANLASLPPEGRNAILLSLGYTP